MNYRCFYCTEEYNSISDIVFHNTRTHSDKEIKIRVKDKNKIKTINYKIIPDLCREQGPYITVVGEINKIHVSEKDRIPKDSPLKKVFKSDSNSQESDLINKQLSEACGLTEEGIDVDANETLNKLNLLLPSVVDTLKNAGRPDEYVAVNRLLSEGSFPLGNIEFLLFLNVVRWFDLKETSEMRYSPDVKLFWSIGLKLFKGRFLRFMGGPKHKFQGIENESIRPGHYVPETSKLRYEHTAGLVQREKQYTIS